MLEFEIRCDRPAPEEIPPGVRESFRRLPLAARSVLAWGEHCTECAIPHCFKTCDLYERRSDGKCRRFAGGIEKISAPDSHYGFITRVRFKPWGMFVTPGSTRVLKRADAIESAYRVVATGIRWLPSWLGIGRYHAPRAFYQVCKWAVRRGRRRQWGHEGEYFLLQVYNPEDRTQRFSLTMQPGVAGSGIPFARLLQIDPGYHLVAIPTAEIRRTIDVEIPFSINLVPDMNDEPITTYFGLMDFGTFASPQEDPFAGRKIKCLVWDLDRTLWDGILVESDPDSLRLRDGVAELLQELDRRGILLSIASKNDPEPARAVLKRLGVADYFLHPEIHWDPKSLSLRRIQRALNIGMDTLALVDDSTFERAEVSAALPEVLCVDAVNTASLPTYACFAGSTTDDSRRRRQYYQAEDRRKAELAESYEGDFERFLASCTIRLEVRRGDEASFDRINDLIQRTNQMNFSSNRYTRQEVADLLAREDLEEYVLSASDRFGTYGIIGFALVRTDEATVRDMLYSCRIQMKHIEHAFLCFLLKRYRDRGADRLEVLYSPTPRNAQCARVFDDLHFTKTREEDGRCVYGFDLRQDLPTESLVAVESAL